MNDQIRVHVIDYKRKYLQMQYVCPQTGKRVSKSSGTSDRKKAHRIAAKWEADLQEGRYKSPSKVTWAEFRRRYEREKLTGLSDKYAYTMQAAMNHLERTGIAKLSQVDAGLLSTYQANLRETGVSESTIRCYLKHLRAALSWGVEVGMLTEVPKVTMPKRARKSSMKGRPITTEEFERMVAAIPSVRPVDAPQWARLLQGLWLSGLRLGESLQLSWDVSADFSVDLEAGCFRIRAEGQKSHRDEILPMTPDFEDWLAETPVEDRDGLVFPMPVRLDAVTRIVSKIGRKANVVVDKRAEKYATAHDLRRSFGTRWASRVLPAVLQKLMRHADIKTTMEFYVDLEASDIRKELRKHNTSHNTVVGTTRLYPLLTKSQGCNSCFGCFRNPFVSTEMRFSTSWSSASTGSIGPGADEPHGRKRQLPSR